MSEATDGAPRKTDVIDTLQSLLVAFVVAMTFRGFVLEGFMIPTGSMGPTLLGQHVIVRSPITGYEYAADSMAIDGRPKLPITDPMISQRLPVEAVPREQLALRASVGDRVLVFKYLWPILGPQRWDVVVFKNPPDPVGETQNYIKRLVGMPDESLLLADGDVFVGPLGATADQLHIARKPEMVQRAVWQPVYDSDWQPTDLARWQEMWRRAWSGPPWKPATDVENSQWDLRDQRAWRFGGSGSTAIEWDLGSTPITDWNAYNVWRNSQEYPVSDIRVAAALEIDDPARFSTTLLLRTRRHRFEFSIAPGTVSVTVTRHEDGLQVATVTRPYQVGSRFLRVDFWHVDEAMRLFIDDREVVTLEYDLGPPSTRLELAQLNLDRYRVDPTSTLPQGLAELRWSFDGGPVVLRHALDRDLYYQPATHNPHNQVASNGPPISGVGFGCNVAAPAQLGPDQFLMLGDNSAASRDGRVWGRPHPLVVRELGFDAPFVVPRSLLVGKAWCVYFPATSKIGAGIDGPTGDDRLLGLPGLAPNFGRLRFIR